MSTRTWEYLGDAHITEMILVGATKDAAREMVAYMNAQLHRWFHEDGFAFDNEADAEAVGKVMASTGLVEGTEAYAEVEEWICEIYAEPTRGRNVMCHEMVERGTMTPEEAEARRRRAGETEEHIARMRALEVGAKG